MDEKSMNIQWYPGHMTKTRRIMEEDLKLVDAVCEILDARIPISSRNPDIDTICGSKPRMIILNRIDMADPAMVARWSEYFKRKGWAVIQTDCKSRKGINQFAPAVRTLLAEKLARYAEKGQVGRPLKLMVVGIPNVGKSTLLSVTSNAHPKIANYHFTTLYPNLGVIYVADGVSFVMADIPGIIEGASEGVGLGHDFLRHIDRCRLLVHIVDVSGSEDRDPIDDFDKICAELEQYSPELAQRPMIVAANKVDLLPPDSDNLERLRVYVEGKGYEFYTISAATTQGTRELMRTIAGKLATLPPVIVYEPEYVKPLAEAGDAQELKIEHYDDLWLVSGPWIMKLLNDINFDDYESRMYFDRQLRKSGLFDRLEEMGIEDGDTVSIYDFEFEYER